MTRTLICLCLGLIVGCSTDSGSPPLVCDPLSESPSVKHYDYHFDLETRNARVDVSLEFENDGCCVSLPFRASDLHSVMLDGLEPDSQRVEEGMLTACSETVYQSDDPITLSASMTVPLDTWNDSQVGYSITEDSEGAPFHYMVSWVGGCDRFGPCDTNPSHFATYRMSITHPSGMTVLCPGTLSPGETESVCEFDFGGGPSYSTFGFAASPSWVPYELGQWNGVDVTFYDMPQSNSLRDFDIEQHEEFFTWMSQMFGPYPYGTELRFAVGPTFWNGFEHPGMIMLSDALDDGGPFNQSAYSNPLAHTTNHEIAHQWAGDQTTLKSTYDFVWKEAMAEYLSYVFDDQSVSKSIASTTNRAWERFSRRAEYWPVPLEKPELIDFYGDVYGPGPMVLFRQIESLSSRKKVLSAIQTLLGQERAIGVSDIQNALSSATGLTLDTYFDNWVYGHGVPFRPTFDIQEQDERFVSPTLRVTQTHPLRRFGGSFVVRLMGDNPEAGETLDVPIDFGPDAMNDIEVSIKKAFQTDAIIVDPLGNLLEQPLSGQRTPFRPWTSSAQRNLNSP